MTLPWYPRDMGKYARDTKDLSMMEHGAYNLLLDYYYSSGKIEAFCGDVSNAKALLPDCYRAYRICSAITRDEQQAVDNVIRKFFRHEGDFFVHDKCDQVIEEQNKKHEKRVSAGRAGGRSKSAGNSSNAYSNAQAMPPQKEKENKKEEVVERTDHHALSDLIGKITGWVDDPRWFGDYSRLQAWIAQGWDPDLDIIPTIRRLMDQRNGQGAPRSLSYFEKAVADAHARRTRPVPVGDGRVKAKRDPTLERMKIGAEVAERIEREKRNAELSDIP